MSFNYDANKTNFHNKGFALSLVSKVRFFGTRKWPIANGYEAGEWIKVRWDSLDWICKIGSGLVLHDQYGLNLYGFTRLGPAVDKIT